MAETVNLRAARKARDAAARRAQANQNAARFGRTKAERLRDAAEAAKAARHLDGHARDGHSGDGHSGDGHSGDGHSGDGPASKGQTRDDRTRDEQARD